MRNNRQELQARFKELYPKKRLLAIQLNGFNHTVFFDNGSRTSPIEIERYSPYTVMDGQTQNTEKLFLGFSCYAYKGNPIEYVYKKPEDR